MTEKKDHNRIKQDFKLRRHSQIAAIAVAFLLLIILAALHKRTDLLGQLPKNYVTAGQIIVIPVFIGFSYTNWRCPSCKKYLGADINRVICGKCHARLR